MVMGASERNQWAEAKVFASQADGKAGVERFQRDQWRWSRSFQQISEQWVTIKQF